jgi:hypothetical protein
MSKIDFQQPLDNDKYFQEYLKTKEQTLKSKTKAQHPRQSHMWAIIFILMISLVSLGVLSLYQFRELQIEESRNRSVAGVNENAKVDNIISADGFSIRIDEQTPNSFQIDRKTGISSYNPNVPQVSTSIIATVEKGNQILKSGVTIDAVEYDNKNDRLAYTRVVQKVLGADYIISSENITIPKDIRVSKITKNNPSKTDPTYYVAVTSNYYFVINVTNETSIDPEFVEVTRFTDRIIDNLYLN